MEEKKTVNEQELYVQIIRESHKKLITLKLLANFFNNANLIAVLIRTKIIHNLFEGNKNLDINKLELFHIQYTNSLIELFQKLKRSKEQNYQMTSDEIYINEDFISRLKLDVADFSFVNDMRVHNVNMSHELEALYRKLESDMKVNIDWSKVFAFSAKRNSEYFRDISKAQYQQLISHEGKKLYGLEDTSFTIESKLLGKLNIYHFSVKFVCGIKCGEETAEVFEFLHSNETFVFVHSLKALYLLDDLHTEGIDLCKNLSSKNQILQQLIQKNTSLKEQLIKIKTSLPEEVESVLDNYLTKVSGVDFLDELQNVDEQTNILKAMLNINIK